jgi:hypothetical protein
VTSRLQFKAAAWQYLQLLLSLGFPHATCLIHGPDWWLGVRASYCHFSDLRQPLCWFPLSIHVPQGALPHAVQCSALNYCIVPHHFSQCHDSVVFDGPRSLWQRQPRALLLCCCAVSQVISCRKCSCGLPPLRGLGSERCKRASSKTKTFGISIA